MYKICTGSVFCGFFQAWCNPSFLFFIFLSNIHSDQLWYIFRTLKNELVLGYDEARPVVCSLVLLSDKRVFHTIRNVNIANLVLIVPLEMS